MNRVIVAPSAPIEHASSGMSERTRAVNEAWVGNEIEALYQRLLHPVDHLRRRTVKFARFPAVRKRTPPPLVDAQQLG